MQAATTTALTTKAEVSFPFVLGDILYWVVRRKNGESVRYRLDTSGGATRSVRAHSTPLTGTPKHQAGSNVSGSYFTSLSRYCNHHPTASPIFEAEGIELRIADSKGCRDDWDNHDLVLDCGAILTDYDMKKDPILSGDPSVIKRLASFMPATSDARVLKIKWMDRAAGPVPVEFWPTLLKVIKTMKLTRILTACQGGHGRSGTSLVALMMCLSDYTPFQAITHLRAMHCARAIESGEQHKYIDEIGVSLGREADSFKLSKVKDYQVEFLALDSPFAKAAQERLKAPAAPDEV